MTDTLPMYTWDYTALLSMPRPQVSTKLLGLGLVIKLEKDAPKPEYWTPNAPKKVVSYEITPKGQAWVAAIEAHWEAQCLDTRWWAVAGSPGVFVIALCDGVHPSEVLQDLRRYFGSTFRFSKPYTEEHCEGNPHQYSAGWRPWKEWKPFLDLRDEDPEKHCMRGAFMRLFGEPVDLELQFYEAAGAEPQGSILELSKTVSRLPGVEILNG